MGGVGLNLYGIKDQWSSFVLHLVVVPNNRLATTIGHVHLDCVEKHKCKYFVSIPFWGGLTSGVAEFFTVIPVTFVTDKGSETGYIIMNQTDMR